MAEGEAGFPIQRPAPRNPIDPILDDVMLFVGVSFSSVGRCSTRTKSAGRQRFSHSTHAALMSCRRFAEQSPDSPRSISCSVSITKTVRPVRRPPLTSPSKYIRLMPGRMVSPSVAVSDRNAGWKTGCRTFAPINLRRLHGRRGPCRWALFPVGGSLAVGEAGKFGPSRLAAYLRARYLFVAKMWQCNHTQCRIARDFDSGLQFHFRRK